MTTDATNQMLTGAIAVCSCLVGLFFFRFWRNSRDRFFLLFALSFWIEGIDRIALGLLPGASESQPVFYGGRVLAYGLIAVAIWQKNRPSKKSGIGGGPSLPT